MNELSEHDSAETASELSGQIEPLVMRDTVEALRDLIEHGSIDGCLTNDNEIMAAIIEIEKARKNKALLVEAKKIFDGWTHSSDWSELEDLAAKVDEHLTA